MTDGRAERPQMIDYAKQFREHLHAATDGGRLRQWEAFRDFADMGYCALAKPWQAPDRQQAFEDRYMANAKRYDRDQLEHFSAMLGTVALAIQASPVDFLGTIYEEEGFADQGYGGQFFTPEHVSDLMAQMIIGDSSPDVPVVTVAEPCCGSGRMIFSAAKAIGDRPAWFDATDLDQTCQHMTFLQMAFAGIAGVVRCGDSITLSVHDWAITPAGAMLLAGEGEASEYLRTWFDGTMKERVAPKDGLPLPSPRDELDPTSPSAASNAEVQLALL